MAKSDRRSHARRSKSATQFDAPADEVGNAQSTSLTKLLTNAAQLPGSIVTRSGFAPNEVGQL
jgi:hypothetical protein